MSGIGRKIYLRIIRRGVPHAILSWRYFLPRQNHMVHLHRKVFLGAGKGYPRIVWFLIVCYSYSLWYLFFSWRQIGRAWKINKAALLVKDGISYWKQLKGLLCLALLHGTPPYFYYLYHLYRRPESEWLNFIYTHELPHWHKMLSPTISPRSQDLMGHKNKFSIEMAKHDIPSVASIYFLDVGDKITDEQLFCGKSFFLKPDQGSRKEGCFALTYHPETDSYSLDGNGANQECNQSKIKQIIEQKTLQKQYVVQPLLENHPLIYTKSSKQLATIRLITALKETKPHTISAVFELPIVGDFELIIPLIIQVETGVLSTMSAPLIQKDKSLMHQVRKIEGVELPLWKEIVSVAEQAYTHFRDIYSIGWDLAITPEGVKLIEGNLNWGVAPHQMDGVQRFNIE